MEREDRAGAVFAPVPGKRLRPVYSFGPERRRQVMFTCPISAIPSGVWDLLHLWTACHAMGTLPKAGGLLDQPKAVQLFFPIFAGEMRQAEGAAAAQAQAMQVAAGAVKAIGEPRK